jgi:hypothetical protein
MADDDWYNRAARRRRHGSHSPASSCSSSTASAITHAGSSNFATTENYGIVAQFYQNERSSLAGGSSDGWTRRGRRGKWQFSGPSRNGSRSTRRLPVPVEVTPSDSLSNPRRLQSRGPAQRDRSPGVNRTVRPRVDSLCATLRYRLRTPLASAPRSPIGQA